MTNWDPYIKYPPPPRLYGEPFTKQTLATPHPPSGIFDKALVSERSRADLAQEAVGMPAVVHGLDDSAHDEFPCNKHTDILGIQWYALYI